MLHQTYSLRGNDLLQPVYDFVCGHYQQAYETHYPGGYLRLYEDYSFSGGNDLMVCLRVDISREKEGIIIIEIISGGGSDLMFWNDVGYSENRRIKHFRNRLLEFCQQQQIPAPIIGSGS